MATGNIELDEEDLATVAEFLETHTAAGDRYFGDDAAMHLWG